MGVDRGVIRILALLATLGAALGCLLWIGDPRAARASALAAVCLGLWLGELAPPFVPTLALLVGASAGIGADGMGEALGWMADPVLPLFFGGFVLGEAASVHGLDRVLLRRAIGLAEGRVARLVAVVLGVTAFLSMWMSNIAAAALMIASLKPFLSGAEERIRRALLVAVALGANLGGMATPIGTGPNAIAIGALDRPPSFLGWMAFALPLTLGSLLAALALIALRHGLGGSVPAALAEAPGDGRRPGQVAAVAGLTVAAWLTEPIHGLPAAGVSLASAAALFGAGWLPAARLGALDWSTLLLVAGGLGVGQLLEGSGLFGGLSSALAGAEAPRWAVRFGLLVATAGMSAVMSNTATAALLVPLAATLDPSERSLPILIAMAASFGMPFVISTPPNAMAAGAGARSVDLLVPGLILMLGGCAVLALTGPPVLSYFGR